MESSKVKALVFVCVLFLLTGVMTVGCSKKSKNAWVNTASLPGQTWAQDAQGTQAQSNPKIVYMGDSPRPQDSFGPRDVDFSFENLR